MSTITAINLPHVMPADAARVSNALAAGGRVVETGSRVGRTLWNFFRVIGESRARNALRELAQQTAATRPELAAQLRQAARRSWD